MGRDGIVLYCIVLYCIGWSGVEWKYRVDAPLTFSVSERPALPEAIIASFSCTCVTSRCIIAPLSSAFRRSRSSASSCAA